MSSPPSTPVRTGEHVPVSGAPWVGASRVGYYVHHVGSGHRHRALALATELASRGTCVTGLSSDPAPPGWPGDWLRLERDDQPAAAASDDPTANGLLHHVPLHHPGLRARAAQVSAWLAAADPDVVISDVSQEMTLLARLHGVPVISVLLPGRRDDDAHRLGLGVSTEIVAFWPPSATRMSPGLPEELVGRVRPLGAQSRFRPVTTPRQPLTRRPAHAVVLAGSGGGSEALEAAAGEAAAALPSWSWTVLGGRSWVADPWSHLATADVVLTHAGQNALAEVAAARVPALVVPQPRPHDEQRATAHELGRPLWPAVVVDDVAAADWARLVPRAAALDGAAWDGWVDGRAAARCADLVTRVAQGRPR